MDRELLNREVKIGCKNGEITNILGCGYEVTFFNTSDSKIWVDAKDIEKYLLQKNYIENNEHPVWNILNKELYVEDFYLKAENMYDFIKNLVITYGEQMSVMKIFFDMLNQYHSETFLILDNLVNKFKEE